MPLEVRAMVTLSPPSLALAVSQNYVVRLALLECSVKLIFVYFANILTSFFFPLGDYLMVVQRFH